MRGIGDYSGPPQLQLEPWVEQMAACMLGSNPLTTATTHVHQYTVTTEASWHCVYSPLVQLLVIMIWLYVQYVFTLLWTALTDLRLVLGLSADALSWAVSLCLWLNAKEIQRRRFRRWIQTGCWKRWEGRFTQSPSRLFLRFAMKQPDLGVQKGFYVRFHSKKSSCVLLLIYH